MAPACMNPFCWQNSSPNGNAKMHFARGDEHDLGAERGHMTLASEALAYPGFRGGIQGFHLTRTRGLPEKCGKGPFIDAGRYMYFDMAHVLAVTLEQVFRVLQGRSPEETELHVVRRGVNVCDRTVAADPAPISPFNRFC